MVSNRGGIALAGVMLVALIACAGGDYEIQLPHGYFVARIQPGTFVLVAPDRHTVVVRGVTRYQVHNDVVFGENLAMPGSKATFFVIDTRQNAPTVGLREDVWARRLHEMGIDDTTLRRPSFIQSLSHSR